MKREIEKDLIQWKNQSRRMPLIIRGARQVGKTFIIEKFGRENFEQSLIINFEMSPEYKSCFNSLVPVKIIALIEMLATVKIQPGKTLLFFDEIQECPNAIMALRYFKEQMPDLHIIGAGSLLEFILNEENFRMPVGRVQFMYLHPLSFSEYLNVSGNEGIKDFLKNIHAGDVIDEVIHKKLLSLVREYVVIGGMPAVVFEYLTSKNLSTCQTIQNSILATYRRDFGKYAGRISHELLQDIFIKAPGFVGKWLKYSTIDPNAQAKTLKKALRKLCEAGLIVLVYTTSASGIPLITHMNEKKCKILFIDIGLLKRSYNLNLDILFKDDLLLINDGALAEQFVGQELLSYISKDEMNLLFSWVREEKNSSAEIDYLVTVDDKIVPIEVKARTIGTLKSLKIFLKEKNVPIGVRISELPFSLTNELLSIPFYLIEEMPRLIREFYSSFKKT